MVDAEGGSECASQTAVGSMLRTARITFPSDEAFAPVQRLRARASCASEGLSETRISFSWHLSEAPFSALRSPNPMRSRGLQTRRRPLPAKKKAVRVVRQGRPLKIDGLYLRQYSGSSTSSALHTSMQASRQAASAFSRLPLASIAAEASVMTWVSNPSRAASIAVNETQ